MCECFFFSSYNLGEIWKINHFSYVIWLWKRGQTYVTLAVDSFSVYLNHKDNHNTLSDFFESEIT